jgi:predicted nuclease of predicted toxin-antitoxin system
LIKILLDQGMPRSAVVHLRDGGWDAMHVYDIGLGRASDTIILERARHDGRIVITLDADFHALLAITHATAPSVIRIRQEGLRGTALAELLLRIWPQIGRQTLQGAMVTITETSIRIRQLPILTRK